GRHARGGVGVRGIGAVSARERADLLGIDLIDAAEAAKLTLLAVVEAMVIAVASDESVAAHMVVCLDPIDDVYWEGQASDPRRSRRLVSEIETGRRRIRDACFRAEIVDGPAEQVWFHAAHEIDVSDVA